MIRRRRRKSHLVEIVLVLVVFLAIWLANMLSHETVRAEVNAEIETARLGLTPVAAELVGEPDAAD